MKINQIEMFIHTLQSGSITEAARKLNKSRTTVSAALSAFEDDLGVQLLHRTGNKVQLTDIGEAIANDCERLLMIANDIHNKCSQHLNGVESAIRIARDDTLPESLWRSLVQQMSERFPDTSISVYVAPPPELEQMVKQNVIDVAYGLLPGDHQIPTVYHRELGQIRMMSVAHKDHPLSQLRKVISTDLERYTEIALAYIENESLRAVTPRSSNFIALPFYEHLRDAVLDGTGWSYVPALLINDHLRDGDIKVLKHNKATSWQPYGEIIENETRRGVVIEWLSDRLENFLLDANH
ncbi:LysR family transcriptional regulator [Photobacterium sp. SDRW27]|uniref:LysR family transcriptional regulator n=1 Tax=Photobacterium obscurum TaxID=2829490 RepID=UPI002244BA45|nr:LysR family transcriptional regulator [Photobacterium obscurum]MCW8329685.1 LysR family transcriptional regulator [Photobacterium obscurum]